MLMPSLGAVRSVGQVVDVCATHTELLERPEILMREHLRHMRDRRMANLLEAGG
jgi:hypothetical protein